MQKKPRWGLITLSLFVLMALVIGLAAWVQHKPSARELLQAHVRVLKGAQVPFRLDEVVNTPERVDEDNPYGAAINALPDVLGSRQFLQDTPLQAIPGQHMAQELAWGQGDEPGRRLSDATQRVIEDLLSRHAHALALADRAAEQPAHGFAVPLTRLGDPGELYYLVELQELFSVMGLRCTLHAYRCEPEALADALVSLVATTGAVGQPVLAQEAMVRARLLVSGANIAQKCLNLCTLPDDTLQRVQAGFEAQQEALSPGRTLEAARAQALQKLPPDWHDTTPRPGDAERYATAARLLHQLDAAALAEDILGESEQGRLLRAGELLKFRAEFKRAPVLGPGREMAHELGAVILEGVRARISTRLVRTLIAAERYRLRHGEWPASARALVPTYLERVPPDPAAGGKPIGYSVEEDGLSVFTAELPESRNYYRPFSMKLLNPELRGAQQSSFHEEVMGLTTWEVPERARALHMLGFTREELGQAGFTTDELGGWAPDMEKPSPGGWTGSPD